jgi:hypothetical protein
MHPLIALQDLPVHLAIERVQSVEREAQILMLLLLKRPRNKLKK